MIPSTIVLKTLDAILREREYGSLLTQLAIGINKWDHAGKYQFIHDNLDKFVRLNQIRVDLELTNDQ